MTTFGITEAGFTLKRLADILFDMVTALSTVQDPVSGEYLTPDLLDENDPMIQVINAFSDSLSVCWEQAQLAYNQFDPLKATGAGLSGLVQLNGLQRMLGSYATVTTVLTGTNDKYIAAGVQVSDMNDLYTFELPAFTFDGSGDATVTGTCIVKGSVVALAGSLVKILTPTSGLLTVTNSDDSTGGTDDETDAELRIRQQLSTAGTAKSVIDSIYGDLAGLTAVTHVRVYQNYTLTTDSRGIPGKQVAVVIIGGTDAEIAEAIFERVPLGMQTYGTTTVNQLDDQGVEYPVSFTRPDEIDIYVEIEIEVINAALWPDDGVDIIKANILLWAEQGAAGLGITDGFEQAGYVPGQTVYASELYTPVNKQTGIRIASILVGSTNPGTEESVDIEWDEIAVLSSANIDVVILGDSS